MSPSCSSTTAYKAAISGSASRVKGVQVRAHGRAWDASTRQQGCGPLRLRRLAPVEITSRHGDAVLISREEYDALEETAHLLRVPANAEHLLESLRQARAGQREDHDLER